MHKLVLVESCNNHECPGKLNRTFEIQEMTEMLNVIIFYIFFNLANHIFISFQVNCEWGRWQDQACDCATGLMTRTRQKLKEKAHGGTECSGKSFDTTACHYLECKSKF